MPDFMGEEKSKISKIDHKDSCNDVHFQDINSR